MMTRAILWPTFALVALIFLVTLTACHPRSHGPDTPPTESTVPNVAELFEMPVLYFALVPLLVMTGLASLTQVVLAWSYVGLRAAHSIARTHDRTRAVVLLFVASNAVLAAMWIGLAVDIGKVAR